MNIQKAKEEIRHTVLAYLDKNEYGQYVVPRLRQRPILLMGPPGIGKTQIMQQIASECRIGLVSYTITHHTRQSAVGLPYIREESFDGKTRSVTEYTMSEIIASIYHYMRETGRREGILFIDEINCVSETLAPTMLQFLQCKTFGNQEIPEGWIIAAAGNPPEYNRSVRDFDFVTLDRVRRMDIEADLEVFRAYARSRHLHPFILSYLELRPGNFYRVENDVDGMQFVTARGWEDLSHLITSYEKLGIPVDEEVIGQFLQHAEIARDAAAYYDLYQKYRDDYDISNILKGLVRPGVYQRLLTASFDERLSCVELLVSGLHNLLSSAMEADRLTDACYDFLKSYQKTLKAVENNQVLPGSAMHLSKSYTESVTSAAQVPNSSTESLASVAQTSMSSTGSLASVAQTSMSSTESLASVVQVSKSSTGSSSSATQTLKSSPAQLWNLSVHSQEEALKDEEKTGLLSPDQKGFRLQLLKLLKSWAPDGIPDGISDGINEPAEAFAHVRGHFQKQTESREKSIVEASRALEYAFTFMEDAFGERQEMVVFVTELTMDPEISAFITLNGCEKYYAYNQTLLIGSRRAELLREIDLDQIRSQASSYEF